jgi:protein-S-isoprenylcysteine O-methyltransferase Ste14
MKTNTGQEDRYSRGSDRAQPHEAIIGIYAFLILAYLAGSVSLLGMVIFLFHGPFDLVNLELGEAGGLVLNTVLSVIFFIQHSAMIRPRFHQWLSHLVRPAYHGAIYTISSGILLLVIMILWQKSGFQVVEFHGIIRWLLHAVFFLSLGIFYWGIQSLDGFDGLGVGPIFNELRGTHPRPKPFMVSGVYRWVRHPLYFSCLLLIWSCPDITADRLLFNILWTVWIVLGTVFEERDLVASFGEAYRDYQRNVPMLIPYRIRPAVRGSRSDGGANKRQ